MRKTKIKKKLALWFGEKQITQYIYDEGKTVNNITVMRRADVIDVFHNESDKIIFTLHSVKSFEIKQDCIIVSFNWYNRDANIVGAYSNDGKIILPPCYTNIRKEKEYFVVTTADKKVGIYKLIENNVLEDVVLPTEFVEVSLHDYGINVVKNVDDKECRGYYSYEGTEIIPPEYRDILFNASGIYVKTHNGCEGFFTHFGNVIIPPVYNKIVRYCNCFVVSVTEDGKEKFGLYNLSGKQKLEPVYDFYKLDETCVNFYKGKLVCAYNKETCFLDYEKSQLSI